MSNSHRAIEPLFNKDKLDEFKSEGVSDGDLSHCNNFEVSHLSKFEVVNYIAKVS